MPADRVASEGENLTASEQDRFVVLTSCNNHAAVFQEGGCVPISGVMQAT
jgi:hypothetical protein